MHSVFSAALKKFNVKPWQISAAVIAASVLAVMYTESEPSLAWPCTPIEPLNDTLPESPCFRATLSNESLVTLEWQVSSSTQSAYIFDDTGPNYLDPGSVALVCGTGPEAGCSTSVRVVEGGNYRWVISVVSNSGDKVHVPADIEIPPPYPLIEAAGGGFVDMLDPGPRSVTWTVDPRNKFSLNLEDAWIEINMPDSLFWDTTHYPRIGPEAVFTVPESALSNHGHVLYKLRDCHKPQGSSRKFCSPPANLGFRVDHDRFTNSNHLHLESGQDLELSFTTQSGNFRALSSKTLISGQNGLPFVVTTDSSYTIDKSQLSPGLHTLELASCRLPDWTCSNRQDAERASFKGTVWHKSSGYYKEGDFIAAVISLDAESMQMVHSPASGIVYFENSDNIHSVDAGDLLAYTMTAARDTLHVLVDSPMQWQVDRDYTLDFYPGAGYTTLGSGQALDLSFDDDGGIWQINEYSNNVEHVSPSGEVETLNLPLGRNALPDRGPLAAVKPFTFWWQPGTGGPTSVTSLAERAKNIGSKIWFTQGGGLQLNGAPTKNNHSRVISYDLLGQDSPATVYDDRFCVYNVPTDDPGGLGNNQVIGLTASQGRIWIAESRGLLNDQHSFISSFIPNPDQCENLLNFDDPDALTGQALQYCSEGRSPEQDYCMEKIAMPKLTTAVKVAHLATDPVNDTVWFNDASGECIGKIGPEGNREITTYKFEDTHKDLMNGVHGMGGFPWNLQLDEHAVYTGEYSTRHIIRFDKASSTYDEIHIPYDNPEVTLHSMTIDPDRGRLWFTLTNEAPTPINPAASTIGYIDLPSWRAHIENPERNSTISGTLYRGLDSIAPTDNSPLNHQAFRGIAFDPNSGKIALATLFREQITVLTPRPGFWP